MQPLASESLRPYNSLALQGRARALLRLTQASRLLPALQWAADRDLPVIALGEGSNVVIAGDLEALVLRIETRGREVLDETAGSVCLRVAAGENWHQLVQWCLGEGYYGLENLALIPGSVGAAPVQNIGAYGVELASFVRAVHCVEIAKGAERTLTGDDCGFGYRDSVFKRELRDKLIITAVDFTLPRQPQVQAQYPALANALEQRKLADPTPQDIFDTVVDIRRSKLPDPTQLPNAGSFFKNPVVSSENARELARQFPGLPLYPQADEQIKLPAAWLIDYCGWKGYRRGDIGVHAEHALVLVNYGGDNGRALLALAAEVAATVEETFGISLEIEPRVYGA